MRKIITIPSVIALMMAMNTSCKKDRVCECTLTSPGSSQGIIVDVTLEQTTKRQAKDACVSRVYYDSQGNIDYQEDCKLK